MSMQIIVDDDAREQGHEIVSAFAAIAKRDADRERIEALRTAYLAAEDAANRLDATPEQIAAWEQADAAYRAAIAS